MLSPASFPQRRKVFNLKILVADKDPQVLSLISARLTPRNYRVTEVSSSEEALRYLSRETVDLILLSTDMERLGGKMLIEKIREKHHLSALPIIMMAGPEEIAELVMSQDRGFDDFLLKPFNPLVLQLRVALNISRMQLRAEANALSQLPGNIAIEKIIRQKIETHEKFSVLYIDINHFKSFNDRYGFEKGDIVICQTTKLLFQTKEKICRERECFIGHVGGDDFIVVLEPADEKNFATEFISEFDRIMPTFYHDADRKRGQIQVTNRKGKREAFPIMSCSIAALTNMYHSYRSLGEIARDAAEVKAFLKSQPGSNYLRDRRSGPIEKLDQAAEALDVEEKRKKKIPPVDPLGRILLDAGLITVEDLELAIKKHMVTGQRLGQTLISLNLVKSQDVGRMLEKKLNVPYVSLRDFTPSKEVLRIFTVEFMKAHRVVPLEMAGTNLKLGMCDPFDLKTLDAIERISGFKPIPCLALEDEFEEFLERREREIANEHAAI